MTNRSFLLSQLIAVAGVIGANHDVLNAATISYSWSGMLRPHDDTSADPWGLGVGGVPFMMSTTVDTNATDDNPVQIPFADFSAVSSRLWVNGEEVTFVGAARIDFSDTERLADTMADTIVMGGDFSKGGQTASIFTLVGLSPQTFSFTSPSETPPQFPDIPVLGSSVHLSQPYITSVTQGTIVSVVPEPHAILLAGLFGGVLFARRRLNGPVPNNLR